MSAIGGSPGYPNPGKAISLLGYKIPVTHQLDGVNITGQIEKRFTAEVFGTRLLVADAEGCDGSRTKGRRSGSDPPVHYDCPKKSADFGEAAKGLALIWSSAGFSFVEVGPVTVDRYGRAAPLFYFVCCESESPLRFSGAAVQCQITVSVRRKTTGEAFVIPRCSCGCFSYRVFLILVTRRRTAPPRASESTVASPSRVSCPAAQLNHRLHPPR